MPSRIVREGINSSARVNRLSFGAEILYRRLMSVADDFGRFHASPITIRGSCWPLCPERVTERQVSKWLEECQQGDRPLISVYEVDGSRYLLLTDFGQQIRTKSKFPQPDSNLISECSQPDISVKAECSQSAQPSRSRSRSRISESEAGPDLFAKFWSLFEEAGKAMNDLDKERALKLWINFDTAIQAKIIAYVQSQMKVKWTSEVFTPMPEKVLREEGWTRTKVRTANDGTDPHSLDGYEVFK